MKGSSEIRLTGRRERLSGVERRPGHEPRSVEGFSPPAKSCLLRLLAFAEPLIGQAGLGQMSCQPGAVCERRHVESGGT